MEIIARSCALVHRRVGLDGVSDVLADMGRYAMTGVAIIDFAGAT